MKWMMIAVLAVAGVAFAGEPDAKAVDAEAYRAAKERLAAKATTQASETERLRREIDHLQAEVASLRKQLAALTVKASDNNAKNTPGIFEFTWGEPGVIGAGWGQRFRANSLADAVQKAKRAGVPVFLKTNLDGEDEVYTGVRKLSPEEAEKAKDDKGGRFPVGH
jgi:septal ring factor EnvC (AmiA/AmiB activator)